MNKKELVEKIADKLGRSKSEISEIIESSIELMIDDIAKGRKVRLVGFGAFELRKRASREGRNPQTGEKIQIPGSLSPAFVAGKALKEAIKK